ncbi:hypothetical protein [Halorussus sp. MSC15.2]|uniref:hypothetical protein n=1 Tax=Halorussus sp. MSC15.2 TaxID=2283638 RepID=UPI0013D0B1D9|nr:hypothetical protein [Halorussus sp. MSC15.2]NEU58116.1 hypothetical protein [Halorussus sp. MSC15.2]
MRDLLQRHGARGDRLAVALVSATLVVGLLGGGVGAESASGGGIAETGPTASAPGDSAPPPDDGQSGNNSTVRQVNPSDIEENEGLGSVEAWLAGKLGKRFERSSKQLEKGEYEAAKKVVGEEYQEEYEQYADITDEMEGKSANVDALERARKQQQAFLTAVRKYERTYDRYRTARENGSERRARRLARELRSVSNRVQRRGDALLASYRAAANVTDTNFSESRRIVANRTANVTARQREVERESFVRTELTVGANGDRTASFTDPLVVTGRLRAANGTPVANRTATFRVGETNVTARTDATGEFRVAYRPTYLSPDASAVRVRFVPDNRSVYRTSNASIPVDVRRVEPTVRLTQTPDSVASNRTVTVRGNVTVNGTPVPGVPVRLTASDEYLGNARTGENGGFVVSGRFPTAVTANRSTVAVSLPLRNAALAPANATTTVPVERVDTAISLNASRNGTTLRAAGRLTTADGEPLAGRAIHVELDGNEALVVAETDGAGRYDARIEIPESAREDGNVTAAASFDGNRGLLPARSAETLAVPTPGGPGSALEAAVRTVTTAPWWALLLVGCGVALSGYALAGRFRPDRDESDGGSGRPETDRGSGSTAESVGDHRTVLLPLARQQLDRGDADSAVNTAYAAVRRRFASEFEDDRPVTHAELYARCRNAGLPDDQLDALRRVTQAYERARFSSRGLSAETAEAALSAGSSLVEQTEADAGATRTNADAGPTGRGAD